MLEGIKDVHFPIQTLYFFTLSTQTIVSYAPVLSFGVPVLPSHDQLLSFELHSFPGSDQ